MDYIHEERYMLPKKICEAMIEKFDSDPRKRPGKLQSGNVDTTFKKCTDLVIEHITDWGVESKRLNDALNTAFIDYKNYLKIEIFGRDKAYIVDQLFGGESVGRNHFSMGRYGVGDYFNWHVDYVPCIDRICNYIIYLNDHEACTEFLNGKKIKPEAGKIVFFPTTWVHAHCGQIVKKGNKYIITGFIFRKKELAQSLPFTVTDD
tara:strand:+ start:218 stop:832 length:615 start_codon:yes stop_codon:yes gene_type:complete